MKHIDLFSGIGGFALAAREVWGEEYENVCFCDINKYAQAVLRKQFGKDAIIYGDIRGLTADAYGSGCGASESKADKNRAKVSEERKLSLAEHSGCRIDLLTGGFPCQPFSQAGKRKGTSDERHLWPEMLRVIREFRPTWVVAENVRGLLTIDGGLVFETCCSDLEREGYEVQPFVIPACAVNAPHRRDRVWIVAHRASEQDNGQRGIDERGRNGMGRKKEASQQDNRASSNNGSCGQDSDAPDSKGTKLERKRRTSRGWRPEPRCENWNENWLEVATRFCGVDDGLPGEMDGVTLSKAGHRVERLKALGNAIVPRVAAEIFNGIRIAIKAERELQEALL